METSPIWLLDFSPGQLLVPAAWLVGGIVVGYILYRFALARVRRIATLTVWGADDIVVGAVHDVVLIWFALGGLFGAVRSMPLRADILDLIQKGIMVVLILSGTWVIARLVADLLKLTMLRSTGVGNSSTLLVNLARIGIAVVGFLVMLQALGIPVGPMLGALGIGGLAIALAMQDTLASLFAGIQLLASKKIQPGDFIELPDGKAGTVIDIDWRNATIRTVQNNDVIVPNNELAKLIVINYRRPVREMSVIVQVGVAYDSDLDHVERVTMEVAKEAVTEVEGGVSEFDPFIRYHTFGDSSIDFSVILRTKDFSNKYELTHEFMKRLKKTYDAEGITIPFPIRTLVFGDDRDEVPTADRVRRKADRR
jgi:small-conductance mechanosensitive channel